jgi:hypothetical protein
MKLNLIASILALLASTGIVKGQCPLPTYVAMLATFDPNVGPLYCNLPSQSIKDLFEFAVGKAFAVDPPPYAFVGTCFPQVIAGFQAFLAGGNPTCQPGQHYITPTYSASNGTDFWLGRWEAPFCFDFTTCNYANLDAYMASIAFRGDDTFNPGEKSFIENGYNITSHSLATYQCWESLIFKSQTPISADKHCSAASAHHEDAHHEHPALKYHGTNYTCGDISMVDVTIASKKPFSVPICNDGCRGVGNGGDLPEEKIMNILEIVAGGDRYFANGVNDLNPYCTSKDTVFTVKRSGNETINASECTPEKAEERAGECTAAPTPAPTVCADSTERFSVTKPDKVTLVTNRSCKW